MDEEFPSIEKGFPFTAVLVGVALFVVVLFATMVHGVRVRGGGKVRTQADATSLSVAVNQYHAEYDFLPDVSGRVTTNTAEGIRLMNILGGNILIDEPSGNPRGIRFLSLRERKGDRGGGVVYDSGGKSIVGLYDEWGKPFTVFLDTDMDEVLGFKLGVREVRLEGRRVAVVSSGKDGKLGTEDDVGTW